MTTVEGYMKVGIQMEGFMNRLIHDYCRGIHERRDSDGGTRLIHDYCRGIHESRDSDGGFQE